MLNNLSSYPTLGICFLKQRKRVVSWAEDTRFLYKQTPASRGLQTFKAACKRISFFPVTVERSMRVVVVGLVFIIFYHLFKYLDAQIVYLLRQQEQRPSYFIRQILKPEICRWKRVGSSHYINNAVRSCSRGGLQPIDKG